MAFRPAAGLEPVTGYTLVRELGRGGFGEVWEASAPGGIRVALKFIRRESAEGEAEQRALEVIRAIRHPHLLDVQFAVRVEDFLVIAMPLCDESLMDRLRACRERGLSGVPRDELLGYMDELSRAVDFLNEPRHPAGDGRLTGVQHRDIKPQNIFLVGGSARLADFGLAKFVAPEGGSHTGGLSPHYAAPEAIEGRVSPRSDQYSLAAAYAHLRAGRRPIDGDSIGQVLQAHLSRPPELSGLPLPEQRVVARALAKVPEERWPTCREFTAALRRAAAEEDAEQSPVSLTTLVHGAETTEGPGPAPRPGPVTTPISQTSTEAAPDVADGSAPAQSPPPPAGRLMRQVLAFVVVAGVLGGAGLLFPAKSGSPSRKRTEQAPPSRTEPGTATGSPREIKPTQTSGAARPPADGPRSPGEAPPPEVPPARSAEAADPVDGRREQTASPARATPARADGADPALASKAYTVLKTYCYPCHGASFKVPRYNVLDRDSLVAAPSGKGRRKTAYVVPGTPDESPLWERLDTFGDMPPEDNPQPSDDDKATIKRWIEAGAPFPVLEKPRPFVAERDVLKAILADLERTPPDDRPFRRYFTAANLHNNRKVLDEDLRLYRAALSKLANSLSWKPRIAVPRAVDEHETVLAIDLRDFGWEKADLWNAIVRREEPAGGAKFLGARDPERKGYPYGLKQHRVGDDETRRIASDIYRLTRCELPYIRADWFVATASRPPIYEAVLGLPAHARELERRLDVDVSGNFLRDRLARAGFASSGVSSHNRMVERHDASFGAYWKSYDFKGDEATAELPRFPLGPVFEGNPFPDQAFEHAGGEIIFHLPNRLQGYLLVNNKDERIEEGPIAIVSDSLQTSGTATIVNGLSCMACHKAGMIAEFKDAIRSGHGLRGEARDKVERLYPAKDAMDRLLADDAELFLAAEERAMGPFLKLGPDKDRSIRDFAEPVGAIARRYVKDLALEDVAAELGVEKPEALRAKIEADPALRRLGLGPLLEPGGTIKRAAWESLRFFNSPMQEAALRLELGTPYHEL